jgi:hypothetical protein
MERQHEKDNIKLNLREIGWGGMDWIDLAQYRDLVNTVLNILVPQTLRSY